MPWKCVWLFNLEFKIPEFPQIMLWCNTKSQPFIDWDWLEKHALHSERRLASIHFRGVCTPCPLRSWILCLPHPSNCSLCHHWSKWLTLNASKVTDVTYIATHFCVFFFCFFLGWPSSSLLVGWSSLHLVLSNLFAVSPCPRSCQPFTHLTAGRTVSWIPSESPSWISGPPASSAVPSVPPHSS